MRTVSPADAPIRERILDAADRLLARYGYRKTTMDDLAGEAGIGKGTTYLHFSSKGEVALGAIDRMVARLIEGLQAIASESAPAPERLRRMLILRVMHRFDYAQPHSRSLDEVLAALRPALLERRERYFRDEALALAQVLREGAREGRLRAADPNGAAHTLITATNALLPYSLSVEELGRRRDVEARAERLVELLLAGLQAPASARSVPVPRTRPSHRGGS
jgi:AcrR family transcriptional regulator